MILDEYTLDQVQNQFALVARYLCKQIETYQPDLIIGLAHAGWLPVELAKGLWAQTRDCPFPPAVRTNFGDEKVGIYDDWRLNHDHLRSTFCGGDSPEDWDHALKWLKNAKDWQAELQAQVDAVYHEKQPPSRVLVVDEFIASGSTWFLFLGLLAALYPEADSCFIDTDLDGWQHYLATLWLAQRQPRILAHIEQIVNQKPSKREQESTHFDLIFKISRIAPGTEDISLNSLHWRPIGAGSPLIHRLQEILPPCDWLDLPRWVQDVCDQSIRAAIEKPLKQLKAGQHWHPYVRTLKDYEITTD